MQLIVIGMHRSGTSVLARLLNLMGAYFAPEGMGTGANQENPKGFWERRDVRALNDFVLHGAGCDWNRVSRFDVSAVPAPLLEEFDKRASQIVLSMDANRPWFMKEPRLCLLLPLWLRVLEAPVCIHILRHPVEVASSLRTRNKIPIEAGLALWKIYNKSAVLAMNGLPRIVVNHSDLMHKPVAAVAALHSKLEALGVRRLTLPAAEEISSFISGDLYREREGRGGLEAYSRASQIQLFEQWSAGSALPEGAHDLAEEEYDALVAYETSLPSLKMPTEVGLRGRAVPVKRDNQASEGEKTLLSTIEEIRTSLGTERRTLQKQLDQRFEELARLTKLYIGLNEALMHANVRVQEQETSIKELQVKNDDLHAELRSMKKDAELRNEALMHANARVQEEEASIKELQAKNDDLHAEFRSMKKDAELRKMAIAHMSAEIKYSNNALASIIGSTSWRMTRFVRALRTVKGASGEASPSDRELVENSGLFDRDWYLSSYPEVVATGLDPITHFLVRGAGQKFNPGPDFNMARYLKENRDVEKSGRNPLIHYLRYGLAEGRRIAKVGCGEQ